MAPIAKLRGYPMQSFPRKAEITATLHRFFAQFVHSSCKISYKENFLVQIGEFFCKKALFWGVDFTRFSLFSYT
jgi:hypothetical protein